MFTRKQHSKSNQDHDHNYQHELSDELFISDSNHEKFHSLPNSAQQRIVKIELSLNGSTYLLLSDGTVFISGNNANGQLGLSHFEHVAQPKIPKWCQTNQIKNIFTGICSKHCLILTQQDRLFAVGNNGSKQFGITTPANTLSSWTEITTILPPQLSIQQIATSSDCTLFLTSNGSIYRTQSKPPYIHCISPNGMKFEFIACGKMHALALASDGSVYSCSLHCNQSPVQSLTKIEYFTRRNIQIASIACGEEHCMALTAQNKIYSWGRNDVYQLGIGRNVPQFVAVPQLVEALQHETVVAIKCGAHHNVAITAANEYYLWGLNDFNQCLKNKQTNESEYDEKDERRIDVQQYQYVEVPTKLECDADIVEIKGIYLGYKETKIVTSKCSWIEHEMNKDANQQQKQSALDDDVQSAAKFAFFKAWYNKWKALTTKQLEKSKKTNVSTSRSTRKKTKSREWSHESGTDSSTDCDYDAISYSPKHKKMTHMFSVKDVQYQKVPVTLQEC